MNRLVHWTTYFWKGSMVSHLPSRILFPLPVPSQATTGTRFLIHRCWNAELGDPRVTRTSVFKTVFLIFFSDENKNIICNCQVLRFSGHSHPIFLLPIEHITYYIQDFRLWTRIRVFNIKKNKISNNLWYSFKKNIFQPAFEKHLIWNK